MTELEPTSIERSFEDFLTGAAELAITHVVTQARSLLAVSTIYVCGEIPMGYNDEYYSPAEGGGVVPATFFMDQESARKWCDECNLQYDSGDHLSGIQYDENWERRAALGEVIAAKMGVEIWDVTCDDLVAHCKTEALDPADYLPVTFTWLEVTPR